MPHSVIECSYDLKPKLDEILQAVHAGVSSTGLFKNDDIKTRALTYEFYRVGMSESSFIHVASKILVGRTSEQKVALSKGILSELRQLSIKSCSLTVEIFNISAG